MEYDLIAFLQNLLGIKGYVSVKPEGTAYPAFVVEDSEGRGLDIHGNNGKPFDYRHSIQINLIGQKFKEINSLKKTTKEALDGFSGSLGSHHVVDCRLTEAATMRNHDKNYEAVLWFSMQVI